ncbi:MAG: glycosyltransferase [Proteobacteria bacterium]|nr:glycosyltransferase [Pseudomonadota bacterium]MCP4919778.1 glycosyltransferase [Pseudomonadota bacterium]
MLSLCLIARDEADLLGACLDSVRDHVDEMVVVDTGSTDTTAEVARAHGARVVQHTWADDFAAARNAALDACQGDWILVLDADERLIDGDVLARAISADDLDLGLIALHNADRLDACAAEVLSGSARRGEPVLLPRLFRRDPTLRWEGIVHETPRAWLERGPRTRTLGCALIHLGNVPAIRDARQKGERNRSLLERRCADDPTDAVAWGYLARERMDAGDAQGTTQAIETGWSALTAAIRAGARPAYVSLATLRTHDALTRGDAARAEETLAWCDERGCTHPNLALLGGLLAEQKGALEEAGRRYGAAAGWTGTSAAELIPGATTHVAWTRLGTIRLLQGHHEAAASCFIRALEFDGEDAEAHLGLAEADLGNGLAASALGRVERLLAEPIADAWILAARACSQLGRLEEVSLLTRQATAHAKEGVLAPHRREQLVQLMQERAIYSGRALPGRGPVGRLIDLLQHRPTEEGPEDATGLEHIALNLVRLGRAAELAPLFERRAEELLPGIEARVRAHLDAHGITLSDDGEPDFVFIGGAGRSGTTLFRTMLSAHPDIWCGPELKLVSAICELRDSWWERMGRDLEAAGVDETVLDAAVRGFVTSLLQAVAPEGQRIAEKTPHDLLHMETLGRLYPEARFIHVVRDGRAVSRSLTRQAWSDPSTGKPVWYCANLTGASRYWAQVVASIRQQSSAVSGRYLEIRYEDLVSEPAATMRRVLAFLGERWSDAVLDHTSAGVQQSRLESSTAAVLRPVGTSAVDGWRASWGPTEDRQLDADAQTMLRVLGYSSTTSSAGASTTSSTMSSASTSDTTGSSSTAAGSSSTVGSSVTSSGASSSAAS